MAQLTASDFVIVYLTGGDSGNAYAALATDCTGCGRFGDRPAYDWAALVQPGRLDELLSWTGAEQVYGPVPWDGRPFGDGNGGTVEWPEGASAPDGEGMCEQAWVRDADQNRKEWEREVRVGQAIEGLSKDLPRLDEAERLEALQRLAALLRTVAGDEEAL